MSRRGRTAGPPHVPKAEPPPVQALLKQGISLLQKGNLADAEQVLIKILQQQPDHFHATHILGVIALQTQRAQRGVELISRAIELDPTIASVHSNLGNGLMDLNRPEDALMSYGKAIALDPNHAGAHSNLGKALRDLERPEEALASCDTAIALKADHAEAWNNRATVLLDLDRSEEALESCDTAITLRPDYAEAYNNRATALLKLKRPEDALASCDKSITLNANKAEAHNNRGTILLDLRRAEEASASYDKAIALNPGYVNAHNNRGATLLDLNRPEDALASCRAAIALSPDNAEAHWNLSLCLLKLGDFERGWAEYEWRWKRGNANFIPLKTNRPELKLGSAVKRLLIWHEQGVGDEVMFASLLPQARALADNLLVQLDKRLISLFERSMPEIEFFPSNSIVAEDLYDQQVPIGGLCRIFCDSLEKFERIRPGYLQADKARVQRVRTELSPKAKTLCGISWRSSNELSGQKRSLDLIEFARLFEDRDIDLVNLQYGDVSSDIKAVKESTGIEILQCSSVDNFNDLEGLAALIEACDLVISADNSTVHFAGALGKPVWVLLSASAAWRWIQNRDDCPWYPSASLYRQTSEGDWPDVFKRVDADLCNFIAAQ